MPWVTGATSGLLSALTDGIVDSNPLVAGVTALVVGVRPRTLIWASPAPLGIQSNPAIVIRITFFDMVFLLPRFGT
jgi:hypothetical protein